MSFVYSVLERFLSWLRKLLFNKKMEICVVGLQKAGKTTFVNLLSTGNFYEDTISTIGFNMRKVTKGKVTIKVWDVGGELRFRSMWERYCRGMDVIVFVVDSANQEVINEAREELHILMNRERLEHSPLLVLGNKNDLPGAMNDNELIERLQLNDIVQREVCFYSVSCKEKKNIDVAVEWLIDHAKYS